MGRRVITVDLKARNTALLERARTALDEFALVRERVAVSMAHSRSLLDELGTREDVATSVARLRRRQQH